jgi:hypothetical protein
LADAAGHAGRHTPLKNYCTGLLLPGERKSVEPMAARLAPDNVRRMHQSLHHLVADAPWNDEEMLAEVRRYVLPTMQKHGEVVAWMIRVFPSRESIPWELPGSNCGQVGRDPTKQFYNKMFLFNTVILVPYANNGAPRGGRSATTV